MMVLWRTSLGFCHWWAQVSVGPALEGWGEKEPGWRRKQMISGQEVKLDRSRGSEWPALSPEGGCLGQLCPRSALCPGPHPGHGRGCCVRML